MSRRNEDIAEVLDAMADSCATMPALAYHLRQAAKSALQEDGYSSHGSERVVSHLLKYTVKALS